MVELAKCFEDAGTATELNSDMDNKDMLENGQKIEMRLRAHPQMGELFGLRLGEDSR